MPRYYLQSEDRSEFIDREYNLGQAPSLQGDKELVMIFILNTEGTMSVSQIFGDESLVF